MALLDNLFGLDALRRFAAARDGKGATFDDRFGTWPGVNQPLPAGAGESDPRFTADPAASSGGGGGGGGGGGWLGDIASKLGNFYLDSVSPVMDVSKYRKPFSLAPGAGESDPRFGNDGANFSMASDPRFSNTDLPPSTNDPQSREPQVFEDGVPLPRPKPQSGLNGTQEVVPGGQGGQDIAAMAQAPDPMGDQTDSAMSMPATGPGAIPVAQQRTPFSMAPAAAPAAGVMPMAAAGGQGGAPAAGGPAAAPTDGSGIGGLMSRLFNPDNAPVWAALGSAAGAGSFGEAINHASAALGPALALKRQNEMKTTGIAATYRALVGRGVPANEALAAVYNPEVMKATAAKYFEAKPLTPTKVTDGMTGAEIPMSFNPNTGQYYDMQGRPMRAGANGAAEPAAGAGTGMTVLAKGVTQYDSSLPDDQYMEQFGPEVQSAVKAYIRGDSMPIANPRLKSLAPMIKLWAQTYGDKVGVPVSDATYSARRSFQTQLGSGSAASVGGQVKAFNQGIEHASHLADDMLKLDNSSGLGVPKLASAVNTLRQEFSTNQASIAQRASALGQTLAGEVGKLFSGSAGGGVHERELTRQRFSTVKSPAELAGALEATLDTMDGGLKALEQRRDEVMGPNSGINFVNDATQQKIEHIRQVARMLRGEASAAPGQTPAITPLAPGETRSIDGVTIKRLN